MRIGLFSDTYAPDINGVVSSIVTLQKELEDNGHDVFIITNHKAMTMKKDGNVLRLPGLELKWLYGYKLSTPYHFSAKEEVRKMNLDVIHVHTEFGVGMFGKIVAKYLNIPVVMTYHTMYEDYIHYINRFDIEEVDRVSKKIVGTLSRTVSDNSQAVISPSDKTKDMLLKYGVKTPIYVIPTGINFDKFNPNDINQEDVVKIRHQYGIKDDDNVVVYIGRIAQEKSMEIPIEAFKHIQDSNIKFLIVGGGPQLEELQQLVKSYQLESQIMFTDKILPEFIPTYYACGDCFVSASLSETQGMTFIEALACGLPVFARPDEVLTDIVVEGDSGYFFKTPKEFAEKLISFMSLGSDERHGFHERAISKIKKYDSKVFYSKIISVYYQAIDDFQDAYEVIRVKAMDDYVRIYVMNEKEDEPKKILIDLDDYFLYKIRVHTMLDRMTISQFEQKEIELEAYRSAIRRLRMRDYTRKEMLQHFQRTSNLTNESCEKVLDELQQKGYINDAQYLINKVDKMQYSLTGKGNIRRTLINKGLNRDDIDEALRALDDDDERKKAIKMAEKLKATIKDKSSKMKKQTIIRKLISLGFESDIAITTGDTLHLDEEDDAQALDKTIAKAIRSNVRKYQGQDLRNRVMLYCMRNGFQKEAIHERLDEMEWNDVHENE